MVLEQVGGDSKQPWPESPGVFKTPDRPYHSQQRFLYEVGGQIDIHGHAEKMRPQLRLSNADQAVETIAVAGFCPIHKQIEIVLYFARNHFLLSFPSLNTILQDFTLPGSLKDIDFDAKPRYPCAQACDALAD
jgi:hypothetical protein